jgi:hydrogenase-4 component E
MSAAIPIPVIQLPQVLTVAIGGPVLTIPLLISVLAVVIAADRNLPDLYTLAALSARLKVVAVPLLLRRLLGRTGADDEEQPGVAGSNTLSPASAVLIGIV